jgi:hypothetical protein
MDHLIRLFTELPGIILAHAPLVVIGISIVAGVSGIVVGCRIYRGRP